MQKITFVLASASAVLATSLDTMAEDKDVIMVSPNDASLYEVEPETQELDEAEFDDENMLQTEEEFFRFLNDRLNECRSVQCLPYSWLIFFESCSSWPCASNRLQTDKASERESIQENWIAMP